MEFRSITSANLIAASHSDVLRSNPVRIYLNSIKVEEKSIDFLPQSTEASLNSHDSTRLVFNLGMVDGGSESRHQTMLRNLEDSFA